MKCPICDVTLLVSERTGVEIDYCPLCRGVWLDRGELDKILEKINTDVKVPLNHQLNIPNGNNYVNYDTYKKHNKKRKSFLGEIFDF